MEMFDELYTSVIRLKAKSSKEQQRGIYRIRHFLVPSLSSPPVNLWESWSLKIFFGKKIYVKNYVFGLIVHLIFLFFCFSSLETIP